MRTRTLTRLLATVAVSFAVVVLRATPAAAACHFFTAQASPEDPVEGATVELTVERDAAVVPSSVRVRTVDGSAVAGEDYVALDQRVEFGSGTTQTVTVETIQDGVDEPDESFTVELSEGEGCEVNQNFEYGPPATITVRDDDEPAATTTEAPTTSATTPSSTTTTEASATTGASTTSTTDTAETTSSTTRPSTSTTEDEATTDVEEATAIDADDDDDGTPIGAVIAAVVVLLGVAAGASALWLRRSGAD